MTTFQTKSLLCAVTLAVTGLFSHIALSESTTTSGAGTLSTSANLDFKINIPRILFFRVGSPGGAINEVVFDPAAATLGDGSDVSATSGGDISAGVVTSRVLSNAGQITITENTSGALGLGNSSGDRIPYSEIKTTSSDATNLGAPTLSNSSTNTSSPVLNSGNLTNRLAQWTYAYDNTALYEAGEYGTGTGTDGSVTYTASSP